MYVALGFSEILDHLEGADQALVVELGRGVGQSEAQGFVSVMLEHELTVDGSLVDQFTLKLELHVRSSG